MLILVIAGLVIDNGGHSPRIEGTEPCTNPANGECLNLQCVSDMQDKKSRKGKHTTEHDIIIFLC